MDTSILRELAEKATPGPWSWNINLASKHVNLEARRNTVMAFWRYGMSNAAPAFCRQEPCILERAEVHAKIVPGREHHADWYQTIDHPDANYIAAANPTTILALLAELEGLRAKVNPGSVADARGGAGPDGAYVFSDGLESPGVMERSQSNTWDNVRDFIKVWQARVAGQWEWFANSRCKYVELRVDMRDGGCIIRDREGVRISPEELAQQYGKAAPTSPPTQSPMEKT